MNVQEQILIPIKKLKHFSMYYDFTNQQILIEKEKVYFTIERGEIFPVLRGLISATQRFYRKNVKHKKL